MRGNIIGMQILWVACSAGSSGLWYSTDGMSWTQVTTNYIYYFNDVYYANGIWVACSRTNGLWYSSLENADVL